MMKFDDKIKRMLGTTKKFGGKNDWDGDGVPNKRDCQPRNTMRQDRIPSPTASVATLKKHGYKLRSGVVCQECGNLDATINYTGDMMGYGFKKHITGLKLCASCHRDIIRELKEEGY